MLVVFASLLLVASAQLCDPYACAPPGTQLGTNVCLNQTASSFQMSICPGLSSTYGCVTEDNPKTLSSCGQILVLPTPALPGQPCTQVSDCIDPGTVTCEGSVCVGLLEGEECSSDQQCGLGLYCNITTTNTTTRQCQNQLAPGAECTNDYQCGNTLGCNGTDEAPGNCIPYFSIPMGKPVGNCVDNDGEYISNLCTSGSCYAGICHTAPTSSQLPLPCQSDDPCVATVGKTTYQKTCSCGYSASGTNGYCPLFAGDRAAVVVRALTNSLINSTQFQECHTTGRFEPYCFQSGLTAAQYQNYTQNQDLVSNYPKYQNNDNCAKANLLNSHYQLTEASFACPAYSCYSGSGWVQNTCAAYNQGSNTYELQNCTLNNYCNVSTLGSVNITCGAQPAPATQQYIGDSCQINSDCISQNCTNSVCIGILSGGSCTDSSYCDLGLYCSLNAKSTCVPLLPVGSTTPCFADSDCVLNAGCNFYYNQTAGICVLYSSVPVSSGVRCTATGYSTLCATNMCMKTTQDYGYCIEPATTLASLPQTCTKDSDCVGQSPGQNATFISKCTCGYNPTGTSYCQLFPGDTPYANYLKLLNGALSSSNAINICQTSRRFQPDCLMMIEQAAGENGYELVLSYYNSTQYSQLLNNDLCVQNIFTSYYWNYTNPPHPTPNPTPTPTGATAFGLIAGVMFLTFI